MTRAEAKKRLHEIRSIVVTREESRVLEELAFQLAYSDEKVTDEQAKALNDICDRYRNERSPSA